VRAGEGAIVGELYEVDDDTLRRLDRCEGAPSFYRREEVELEDGGRAVTYTLREEVRGRAIVRGGDWCARNEER
jgi:gamma-glutamylcyclotransferase (GGCT)/AIG2-like uncharacterized protein YtfP